MVDVQLEDGQAHIPVDHLNRQMQIQIEMLDLPSTMESTLEAQDTVFVEPVINAYCRQSARIWQAQIVLDIRSL
jgi:hypothetical protein